MPQTNQDMFHTLMMFHLPHVIYILIMTVNMIRKYAQIL